MPPNRLVPIVVKAVATLIGVGGIALMFVDKSLIIRATGIPGLPEAEFSATMLAGVKEFGALAVLVSVLMWFAAASPIRNVAIIDALIVGFLALAAAPVLSRYLLNLGSLYPPSWTWIRTLIRIALAALLFLLRISSGPARDARNSDQLR